MTSPILPQQPNRPPGFHQFPDPQQHEDLSRLGDEITEMAAHLTAGTCQLLELIQVFDEEGGWHGFGINSCAHWLNWKCGMSMGTAREQVRVARALPALPKILASFRIGKVSYSKVRAMTRVATPKNEEVLLNVALHGTAAHVETQVRLYRRVKRFEALEQENLPLDQVLPYSFASRRADALERVVEGFLAGTKSESSGGDRYLINIHTEVDTLRADGEGAESEIEDRGHVPAETSSTGPMVARLR